jgi:hypothetical protein
LLEVPVLEEPVPELLVGEESGTILIQGMPAQAEMVIVDALLGDNGANEEVAEPRSGGVARGEAPTPVPPGGIGLDFVVSRLVLTCPRAQPRAMQYIPLGP